VPERHSERKSGDPAKPGPGSSDTATLTGAEGARKRPVVADLRSVVVKPYRATAHEPMPAAASVT
jgi:hypothetical protein